VKAWAVAAGLSLAGCGGAAAPATWAAPAQAAPAASLPIATPADVDLRGRHVALVHGQPVTFDGMQEGLVWPALEKALGPRRPGDVVTIQVAREVPVEDVLRAAWTAHRADLRVQSFDATGVMHAVELRARREGAAHAGCHLAVFLRPDGVLRVAAPGGPRQIAGEHAAESLARSLAEERTKCPIQYVAFGAESDSSAWGPVFDVLLAVDAEKAAGDARYVLGQAMHAR
jgi:hypothetical protein